MSEGEVLAKHLLGKPPDPVTLKRYALAVDLLPELRVEGTLDRRVLVLAGRWPWTVGPLDAMGALVRPARPLHHRLTAMAAILETTPDYADRFLPLERVEALTLGRLLTAFLLLVPRILIGCLLLVVIVAFPFDDEGGTDHVPPP